MTAIPTWHALALCRTEEGDWFADSPALVEQAKAVCGRCAVSDLCLQDAVARGDSEGLWGGLTTQERDALFGRRIRHGVNSTYAAGGCRCEPCRRAHARYVAEWRARAPVTRRPIVVVAVLAEPAGRGHSRAWPGQMFIQIGQAA